MLWQKELVDGELVHVKLMSEAEQKSFSHVFEKKMLAAAAIIPLAKKCNLMFRKHRKEGNVSYEGGHFAAAISAYNQAVKAAESGSEELGIAYANRSASFFKLKEYALCLGDIELAKKNHYPAQYVSKLDRRHIECENQLATIGNQNLQSVEPKLSFKADQKIPCFASGLEVNYSQKYGKHIRTTRDLDIGQTVIVEWAFVYCKLDEFCDHCYKQKANLIPCERCVTTMFCSKECRNAAKEQFHGALCEVGVLLEFESQHLLMKSIMVAIKTFSTVEALMAAIETFRTQNGHEIVFDDPAKRDYFQFFNLRSGVNWKFEFERNFHKQDAMEVVEILHFSKIRDMFQLSKTGQFLSHLALHHMHIISCNFYMASHGIPHSNEDVIGVEESTNPTYLGIGITIYSSQMNHSCAPNVGRVFINDTVIYKVIRPIRSGEQLFISYL